MPKFSLRTWTYITDLTMAKRLINIVVLKVVKLKLPQNFKVVIMVY